MADTEVDLGLVVKNIQVYGDPQSVDHIPEIENELAIYLQITYVGICFKESPSHPFLNIMFETNHFSADYYLERQLFLWKAGILDQKHSSNICSQIYEYFWVYSKKISCKGLPNARVQCDTTIGRAETLLKKYKKLKLDY